MQLIVLAAGMGTRLGALTQDAPKCFVRIHESGETFLERTLRLATSTHCINRIILVTGYKEEMIKELIGTSYEGVPVLYVSNPIYDQTNNIYSLALAADYMKEDDTLLIESDLIYDEDVLKQLLSSPEREATAVVARWEDWMDGTVVTLADPGHINRFIGKSDFDETAKDSYYKTVNIYRLSQAFSTSLYLPLLDAYIQKHGRGNYYENVFQEVLQVAPQSIHPMVLQGDGTLWYEVDNPIDLAKAQELFLTHSNTNHTH